MDPVAEYDQALAAAVDALRHASAFILFVAHPLPTSESELGAYVACPREMVLHCRQILEDAENG